MLTTTKKILLKAQKGRYGVPAFNINNLEFLQAVIKAAQLEKSPVIIQTSEGAIKYAGMANLVDLVRNAAEKSKVGVALHLDHGRDMGVIKKAINSGYTSVMIDGSHYKLDKNINVTKKVVGMAHRKKVSVEAELGTIGGAEDNVRAKEIIYTDPDCAKEFVDKTGIDSLAVAIGTSHGAYKFKGGSHLNFKLLKKIRKKIRVPLVLHGASSIPKDVVKVANRYGATLKNTMGVAPSQVRKAVRLGICKVNIDSDLRIAFDAAIRRQLRKEPGVFDPRKILMPAMELITNIARKKMRLVYSSGKE